MRKRLTVGTVKFVHESVEMDQGHEAGKDMKLEMAKGFSMATWTKYRSSTGKVDDGARASA
jgi:hypothetical protein